MRDGPSAVGLAAHAGEGSRRALADPFELDEGAIAEGIRASRQQTFEIIGVGSQHDRRRRASTGIRLVVPETPAAGRPKPISRLPIRVCASAVSPEVAVPQSKMRTSWSRPGYIPNFRDVTRRA
jgi:hypothetical protein